METFVTRQIILDRRQKVFGYKIIFRPGFDQEFQNLNPDPVQTTDLIVKDTGLGTSIRTFTGGKKAFVNFTENTLNQEYAVVLPKEYVVVELLCDVEPTEEVFKKCQKLKNQGYLLLIDYFTDLDKYQPLINLGDIMKIDFRAWNRAEREDITAKISKRNWDMKFLAENVDTREEFNWAYSKGYDYFQGYFFSEPENIGAQELPVSNINYLSLLREVNKPVEEYNFAKLDDIIKRDVTLSFKILKYVNTLKTGVRQHISSIKQALVILGQKEVKKVVALYALSQFNSDKQEAPLVTSVVRARFCEQLAPLVRMRDRSSDLFLMGLFSMVDVLLGQPREQIIKQLPMAEDMKEALMAQEGVLNDLYQLMEAYEKGAWEQVGFYAQKLQIEEEEIPRIYFDAVEWANQNYNDK